jgi:hypothetical protein
MNGWRRIETEAVGGVLDHEAVADQQRLDLRIMRETVGRLDGDLWPDAVGIAERDGHPHDLAGPRASRPLRFMNMRRAGRPRSCVREDALSAR